GARVPPAGRPRSSSGGAAEAAPPAPPPCRPAPPPLPPCMPWPETAIVPATRAAAATVANKVLLMRTPPCVAPVPPTAWPDRKRTRGGTGEFLHVHAKSMDTRSLRPRTLLFAGWLG